MVKGTQHEGYYRLSSKLTLGRNVDTIMILIVSKDYKIEDYTILSSTKMIAYADDYR